MSQCHSPSTSSLSACQSLMRLSGAEPFYPHERRAPVQTGLRVEYARLPNVRFAKTKSEGKRGEEKAMALEEGLLRCSRSMAATS
eukprot:228059-Pleurochrysis_carterae.AAC.2